LSFAKTVITAFSLLQCEGEMLFTQKAECSRCGEEFPADKILTVCTKCGGALLFRYDLDRVANSISKNRLEARDDTFWKFIELLPLSSAASIISLGEPYTPLLRLPQSIGSTLRNVYVKDDGRLPTGTFKARGMAVAVSKLKELHVKRIAVPSAGNAASALAAYGAAAEIEVFAFMPKDVPELILKECFYLGAKTYFVDGLINDAGDIVKKLESKYGWFNISTNKQPYRVEGYKAIAFEIAEQFNWKPPDTIIFPTGGGEGVIGLWKGFEELIQLGWVEKMPRLIIVQAGGCAPLVKAFNSNQPEVKEPWKKAETIAAGLRVPYPFASYLIFRALKETKGKATMVEDEEILSSMKALMMKGIYACPEAAASLAALGKLENQRQLDPQETILLYLTGSAMKYFDVLKAQRERVPILKRNADSLD
jgi:threonine synthase